MCTPSPKELLENSKRYFIKEGPVILWNERELKKKDRWFFMFNDVSAMYIKKSLCKWMFPDFCFGFFFVFSLGVVDREATERLEAKVSLESLHYAACAGQGRRRCRQPRSVRVSYHGADEDLCAVWSQQRREAKLDSLDQQCHQVRKLVRLSLLRSFETKTCE